MLLWILMIVGSVLLDQVSKRLVVAFLMEKGSVDVIPNVLRFTYVENRGAAFGMLSEHRWIFMVVSTIAILAMLIYLWKFRPESKLACAAISLIVGGGIGNMIDRVYLDYVIDFIDFCAFDFWVWVFNIADACVCVGGGLLLLWCVLSLIQESRADKKNSEADEERTEEQKEQE
ncbi:MAG: signal peptidase II [Clostridia bacterium]|nr:signal peptidase II [Clostridia bacterium]